MEKYLSSHKVKFTICDIQSKITNLAKKKENISLSEWRKNRLNQPRINTDVKINNRNIEPIFRTLLHMLEDESELDV